MARIDDSHGGGQAVRGRSFWFRKRWLVLLLLAGLVWLAPQIVASTPLLQTVVDRAAPELEGRLRVESASLGWFSPVVLRGITWRDADDQPLAEVRSVRIERNVYQLLTNASDLGEIRVAEPRLTILARDDGTNLEDALAPLLAQPSSSPTPQFTLIVEDGTIDLLDAPRQTKWQLEKLTGTLSPTATSERPAQAHFTAQVHDSQGTNRPLEATCTWRDAEQAAPTGESGVDLALKTTATPLGMLRPLLARFAGLTEIAGVATCDLQLSTSADGKQQECRVMQMAVTDLALASPSLLGAETLHTQQLSIVGEVEHNHDTLRLTGVQATCDFARLAVDGQLSLAASQNAGLLNRLLAALQSEDYRLHGEVDLAQLAALLPNTLNVRAGTQITAGNVTLDLASRLEGKKRRWDGELKTSKLAAIQDQREIIWDEPITISLAAQQGAAGPVIERLTCVSSFLNMQGRGTLEQGELTANGSLAKLLTEANRFFALDDLRLAGELSGQLAWRREMSNSFTAQGQAQIADFEFTLPGQTPWREPQLLLGLDAVGELGEAELAGLSRGDLQCIAGEDQVVVQLAQPVARPSFASAWPLKVTARGELARWLPRVQTWLPVKVESASGGARVEADVVASSSAISVSNFKLDLLNLKAVSSGLFIDEPEVHINGDAAYALTSGELKSQSLTVATSALALRADQLAVIPRETGVALSGEVGYRADLARLGGWLQDPRQPQLRKVSGRTEGRMQFAHEKNVTFAKWTAEFADLTLASRVVPATASPITSPIALPAGESWMTVWQEPKVSWHGQGEFDHTRGRISATHLNVASDMLNVTAHGQIEGLTSAPTVDLQGEIAYDLARVAAILASYWGDGFKMTGADKRQFTLRGPLPTWQTFASQDSRAPPVHKLVWPSELVGQAGIGWNSAEIYALPIGPGKLEASLQGGLVNFAPLDLKVADGSLKAWPRLVLSNEPMVLQFAQGTQVEKVNITPQMCHTWLKFVAPLVADATRAEGKFSAKVGGATLPLFAPLQGDGRGVLSIHGARVGPGPLAEQYVLLAKQVRSIIERKPLDPSFRPSSVEWLTLPEQNVDIQLTGGRVYHRGLQLQIGDTTLVTSGSVGEDQSLSLIIEIPIRDEWIAKDRFLSSLRGQSLQVPVTGTVGKPQLDNRALQQLAGQLINSAAGNLLEQQLQRGLNKLLPSAP